MQCILLLQVTPTPTTTTDKMWPPSPNHGTLGASERMIGQNLSVGYATDKKKDTSMEVAEGGGGSGEGDTIVGTSAEAELLMSLRQI